MTPTPILLTAAEACRYLRLDEGDRSESAQLKALDRLITRGLRPCIIGRHRRFSIHEINRFVAAEIERYADVT